VLIACDLAHAHDAYRNLLRHVSASMIVTLHPDALPLPRSHPFTITFLIVTLYCARFGANIREYPSERAK
jgi:hypothetical protein